MKYIFIDPSGSFNEGKGHTGIATIQDDDWDSLTFKSIAAKDFTSRHLYWQSLIKEATVSSKDVCVIIESFMIRNNGFLLGKMPETILCIGAIIWELEELGIPYVFQTPTQAKARFKDSDLCRTIPGLETKTSISGRVSYYLNDKLINDHIRDALKHLLYYKRYHKEN